MSGWSLIDRVERNVFEFSLQTAPPMTSLIDLRSDTVTHPTGAMRAAKADLAGVQTHIVAFHLPDSVPSDAPTLRARGSAARSSTRWVCAR